MLAVSELRRVECYIGGKWKFVRSIGQLERGDIFRMFEGDGTPVENEYGNYSFVALEHPGVNSDSLP